MNRFYFTVFPLSDSKCRIVSGDSSDKIPITETVIDMIFISTEIDHNLKHHTFSSRETVVPTTINYNCPCGELLRKAESIKLGICEDCRSDK